MKVNRLWIKQFFLLSTEHGAVRVLDALTSLLLIRIFTAEDLGLFSLYQSWVGLILLFLPSLEVALYRDYGKLKESGKLKEEFAAYRSFNQIKLAIAIVLILALSFLSKSHSFWIRLSLLSFALALPLSQALYGYLREPLKFELKQEWVILISVIQRMSLIACLWVIAGIKNKDPIWIGFSAIFVYLIFGKVWSFASKRFFKWDHKQFSYSNSISKASQILHTTVFWMHLNGVITQFIQTLDTFFLGIFKTDLKEIALYSISLKAANFLQIFPIAAVNTFGVYLARTAHNKQKEQKFVLHGVLLFCALSAFLVMLAYLISDPLLIWIGKTKVNAENLPRIKEYFFWHVAGVGLYCAGFPLSTYLGARTNIKKMFYYIFLPWIIGSLAVYGVAAYYGPSTAAKSNILVNALLYILMGSFGLRKE